MRGTIWRTVGFVAAGAVIGTLAGDLLSHQVPILGRAMTVSWHPSADLGVVRYSISIVLRVNLMTLAGVIGGYVVRRRFK